MECSSESHPTRPARATVVAALVDASFLIEIEAIAKLP